MMALHKPAARAVTRLDLRLRRRAAIGYALGLAAYVAIIVALYPTFRHESGLDRFSDSTVAALFGANGSLTSPSGWMNANVYGNFLPLILLVLTLGYGASCLAGQDEDGTLGLLATLPVSRAGILRSKLVALVLQVLPAAVLTAVAVVAGRAADLDLGVGAVLATTLACVLLALDFGILALVIGARTGSRGTALGVASGVAAASYLISSLAPVTDWVHPIRFVSLFYWAVGNGQLKDGVGGTGFAVLVAVGVLLALAARPSFERMDIH